MHMHIHIYRLSGQTCSNGSSTGRARCSLKYTRLVRTAVQPNKFLSFPASHHMSFRPQWPTRSFSLCSRVTILQYARQRLSQPTRSPAQQTRNNSASSEHFSRVAPHPKSTVDAQHRPQALPTGSSTPQTLVALQMQHGKSHSASRTAIATHPGHSPGPSRNGVDVQ